MTGNSPISLIEILGQAERKIKHFIQMLQVLLGFILKPLQDFQNLILDLITIIIG